MEGYYVSVDHVCALYPANDYCVVLTSNGERYKVGMDVVDELLPKEKKKVVKKDDEGKESTAKNRKASKKV